MTYIVKALIELPAKDAAEAESLVMGSEFYDIDGKLIDEVYIEIEEVLEG